MATNYFTYFSLFLLNLFGHRIEWKDINHVIALGDSYTHVQGTHGRQNYSFIGDNLPSNFSFTPTSLLSNLIVQTQTATSAGGPNWIEFLTGCGLHTGLTDPKTCEKQLWDFAFAGADITEELLPLHHDFTVMFDKQIEQFVKYAQPVLQNIVDSERTLVVVWIGINDINDSSSLDLEGEEWYAQLIDVLFQNLKRVYELGYQKFLILNLPPLGRTLGDLGKEVGASPSKEDVRLWNEILECKAKAFGEQTEGSWVKVFDANGVLKGVLDAPGKYQIRNVTGYCPSYNQPCIDEDPRSYGCLPLEEYFWYNSGHVTSHVHQILADAVDAYLETWL